MSSNDTDTDSTADDNFASLAEITVSRDSDGYLAPRVVEDALKVPTENGVVERDVQVLQMAYGDAESMFGDDEVADVGPGIVAKLFDDHLITPEGPEGGYTEEYVADEMLPLAVRDLMLAIMEASGMQVDNLDVDDSGNAEVEFGGN